MKIVLAVVVAAAAAAVLLHIGGFAREALTKPRSSLEKGEGLPEELIIEPFKGAPRTIEVASPAFEEGERIPPRFTCDGDDVSPRLEWRGTPPEAKSLAIVMYDPDAPGGIFLHWLLYDVNPQARDLEEAVPKRSFVEGVGKQAINDFGRVGYGGPCPPPGPPHRYVFVVAALDVDTLGFPGGASGWEVLEAMRGHVIAYGYTFGVYSR
ncbi:MAG: YbhB/YbcL family Raf kinase inhibitor-like protein [Thermoproteota archaeon]